MRPAAAYPCAIVINTQVKLLRHHLNRPFLASALLFLALLPACSRKSMVHHDYMYVSAAETSLRDRVATMYNKVGTVQNGDRVEVLERQRRFLRVRTDKGQEGWIEERSLVPQDIYDGFQKLVQDNASTPVQGRGTTRAELNMHLTASRDAEHLYQLKDGEKIDILRRATALKNPPKTVKSATSTAAKPTAGKAGAEKKGTTAPKKASAPSPPVTTSASASAPSKNEPPPLPPVMEDWYLVRNSSGHVGWVLLRMIDLDVPLDVAQYAEGQRIIAYFVLNTVDEDGKQVPQYLMLLNQPKDGLAWDYNQIRVFTRNRAKHRYETAYRERDMEGYLPVKVGHQVFDKEGDLPTFTIRKKNDQGQIVDMTYKLNGPIVHRVLTPEEEAAEKQKHDEALAARMQQRAAQRAQHPSQAPAHKHKKH
jgi:SH3-like domain-containing protein